MKHIVDNNPAIQHPHEEPHQKPIYAKGRSTFHCIIKPLLMTVESCHVYLQPQHLVLLNPEKGVGGGGGDALWLKHQTESQETKDKSNYSLCPSLSL